MVYPDVPGMVRGGVQAEPVKKLQKNKSGTETEKDIDSTEMVCYLIWV